MNRKKTYTIVRTALMTALLCVCSWITIPSAVPFTLQTFGVFCALLILGGQKGTLSVLIYIILGAVGLPVFSGFRGGMGHLVGPTGGYIIGFLFTCLVYMAFEPLSKKNKFVKWISLSIGLLLCYAFGTLWFAFVSEQAAGTDILAILSMCVFPYIVPDVLKMIIAAITSERIPESLKSGVPENSQAKKNLV